MVEELSERAPTLAAIGQQRWKYKNAVGMLERCVALRGKTMEEANCSDQRLYNYLHHAQALLFPPSVEGYGMPLAEALSTRVPVTTGNLPVFREIIGEIPDYLDPPDDPDWMTRVLEYSATNSIQRASQLICTEGFREPTWQQHSEVADQFIEELA